MIHETLTKQEKTSKFWINKNVLITGGSTGLGKALAVYLSSLDANVVVFARKKEQLELLQAENNKIITFEADISNKSDIYKIAGQTIGELGQTIDVVINNASTLGINPLKSLLDTPCENFSETLETNLLGPFRLIKALLPGMLLNHKGLIVNITSDASISAYPDWGIYSISKAALDHMTAIWSKELPEITFVSIDPGDMYTNMQLEANPEADEHSLYNPSDVANELSKFLAILEKLNSKTRFNAQEWRSYIS